MNSALDWLWAGGPVMLVLLAVSVVSLAIIVLKVWQFAAVRITRRAFVEEALAQWHAGRAPAALRTLSLTANPIARVMEVAIRARTDARIPEATAREEVARVAAGELEQLRTYLRGLEVIAALSPLLGLLGTVLGMIEAFQQLELAGARANPAVLSGGIWEALLTTAAGLTVAMPALVAFHWLERAVDRLRHDMEDAVTRVFTAGTGSPGTGAPAASARATDGLVPSPGHAH